MPSLLTTLPITELFPLVLLGMVLGLDVVSVPQAMISRPIVGATLTGMLLGAPVAGLGVGAALECVALETLPVGAARYPEWGSASVVGALVGVQGASASALPEPSAWLLGVVTAMATAWLGGWSMVQHRHLLARLARPLQPMVREGSARTVRRIQYTGIALDAVRAAVITGVGATVTLPVARALMARWTLDPTVTRALLVIGVAAVAANALWQLFHGVSVTRRLFIAGLLLGTLGVVVYG